MRPDGPEESRKLLYAIREYMSHLDLTEFLRRAADIYTNLSYGTPPNVLVNSPPGGWSDLWSDVEDEAQRRFGDGGDARLRTLVEALAANRMRAVHRVPWFGAVYDHAKTAGTFLVKYGKHRYLEPAFRQGKIRVQPASFYSDPSLNPAVKDDELGLAIQPHPDEFKMEVFDRITGFPKGSVNPINNVITKRVEDHYVLCLSEHLSEVLLDDFEADACLLIFEPGRFFDRVFMGLNEQLPSPYWGWEVVAVKYVDPLNTRVTDFSVYRAKHFSFAYQQECRLIWGPSGPIERLRAVDLVLGSMKDCCCLHPS